MGSFRFRKSIRIAPGLKVNLNKKSVSMTAGRRGAHVTRSFGGRSSYSVGAPGTGLWYRGSWGRKRNAAPANSETLSHMLATAPAGTAKAKIGNFFMWVGGLVWIVVPAWIVWLAAGQHHFGAIYLVTALLWTALCIWLSYRRHSRLRAPR